jgi:hypothetical protein
MARPEVKYPALEGMHDTLKESHQACVVKVHNFGVINTRQRGVEEAEKVYRRTFEERETALGPNHALTINAVDDLVCLFLHQNKLDRQRQY